MADFSSLSELLYDVGNSLLKGALKRVLQGAGLGLVSYAGISEMLETIIERANAQLAQGDGYALSILGLGGVDTCLSMILSACIIRASMGVGLGIVRLNQ